MKRRDILTKSPAAVVTLAVGVSGVAEASSTGAVKRGLGEGRRWPDRDYPTQGVSLQLKYGGEFNLEIKSGSRIVEYSLERVPWEAEGQGVLIGPGVRVAVNMGEGKHMVHLLVPHGAEVGRYRVAWITERGPDRFCFEVVDDTGSSRSDVFPKEQIR